MADPASRQSGLRPMRMTAHPTERNPEMAVGPNDVNILSVETENDDSDYPAGKDIKVIVRAEVGQTLFNSGAKYRVGLAVVDTTVPAQVFAQDESDNYNSATARWKSEPIETFTYTVPGAQTTGRETHQLSLQAYVIGNMAGPRDASQSASSSLLITPA